MLVNYAFDENCYYVLVYYSELRVSHTHIKELCLRDSDKQDFVTLVNVVNGSILRFLHSELLHYSGQSSSCYLCTRESDLISFKLQNGLSIALICAYFKAIGLKSFRPYRFVVSPAISDMFAMLKQLHDQLW